MKVTNPQGGAGATLGFLSEGANTDTSGDPYQEFHVSRLSRSSKTSSALFEATVIFKRWLVATAP